MPKRGYPRFLYSYPKNTIDKGPFVVHCLEPFAICKIHKPDSAKINVTKHVEDYPTFSLELLHRQSTTEGYNIDVVPEILDAMHKWIVMQIKLGEIQL